MVETRSRLIIMTKAANQIIDWVNRIIPVACLAFIGWIALSVHNGGVIDAAQAVEIRTLRGWTEKQETINQQVIQSIQALASAVAVNKDRLERD